jgi:predicted enzyme related to lactoylglutathione lyase
MEGTMPTFTTHATGSPCWIDLMTPDVDGSKAFYQAVFGWDAEDQFDPDGNRIYTNFSQNGLGVAGMGQQPPEMAGVPPVWNTYIAVDDPAATAEKVTGAGGIVMMPPMDVMDAGSMAIFADPTGAAFSVWKAGNHIGAGVCNEPDTWSWNELMTRDIESATRFYTEVFGWGYDEVDMGPMGTYHVIQGGENDGWGGLMAMPPDVPDMVPNHWMVYFAVADVDATIAKVTGAGGMVGSGPMDIPGVGRTAVVHDPAGGSFSVLQPAPQE